jgi:uncharacterized protein (PEP-CTERM system associated)
LSVELDRRESRPFAGAALAACLAAGAAKAESLRVVPNAALTESYSDNVALERDALAKPGWVTGITPGIRADLEGARVKGFLDYRLSRLDYSSAPRLNGTQRFLNSFANVEAVEDRLFVEARADITQQNRSPFGAAVTPGVATPDANRVETTSYQVAPSLHGDISDIASYRIRVEERSVRADEIRLPQTRTTELTGRLGSPSRSVKLGWAVDVKALSLRNEVAGKLEDSHVRVSGVYAINPQLHVSVTEGYETTDFASPSTRRTSTPGAALDWTPGVRTRFSAVYEKRFFGDGHSVVFSHRTPLTAWRVVSHKDVAVLPTQLASRTAGSLESLMSDLWTSAIPDPEDRAEAVRRRLEETGISGSSVLSSNFVSARPFVFRNDVGSFALLGRINTATLTIVRKEQRGFGVRVTGEGGAADEDFRQRGINANLAHKLTPLTTLTLTATSLRTEGLTATPRQSTQNLYSVFLSTRLGPRTSASFGLRRSAFRSSTELESYRENAVFGSVSVRL